MIFETSAIERAPLSVGVGVGKIVKIETVETPNGNLRVDIFLNINNVIAKYAIFVSDSPVVATSGKNKFINEFGETAWAMTKEEITYNTFFREGSTATLCKKGQEEFIAFLRAVNNTFKNDTLTISDENWTKLCGKSSDLTALNGKQLVCLLGVSGQHQRVFPRFYGATLNLSKACEYYAKALTHDQTQEEKYRFVKEGDFYAPKLTIKDAMGIETHGFVVTHLKAYNPIENPIPEVKGEDLPF